MSPATSTSAKWWKIAAVWVCRIISGAAFTMSGWAKSIDPEGFVIKITEYLRAWGIDHLVPTEAVLVGAVTLSIGELIIGILLLTGSLRRSAPIVGLVCMTFMLPLTAYIWIADPVADCGCFGDLWHVSNFFTFLKNIFITAALILCLIWHKSAHPLYRPGLQWLIIALTGIYGLFLALLGWNIQPIVDFRPYGIGKPVYNEFAEELAPHYIYAKSGQQQEFALDALPDSTWTYIGEAPTNKTAADAPLAIFDGDDEVTEELQSPQKMLIFTIPHPGIDNLMRSRFANTLAVRATHQGVRVIFLVAATGKNLDDWEDMFRPFGEVYSASDTSLKQLVRGKIGLVYLDHGKVGWKRNFTTISPDLLSTDNLLESIYVVDDGRLAWTLSGIYIGGMLLLLAISALTKINFRPRRKKAAEQVVE